MNRFRHHIERPSGADGFRARLAGAESCLEQFVSWPLSGARHHVSAKDVVAGETVAALGMARGGFVLRLDLRPDVLGERHALRRKTEASFAALAAPGIGAGQRRVWTLKEDLFA